MTLTDRQREIYDYIVAFRNENGCSPSIPEIQRHFGIRSPNGVAGHLRALETKGIIRRAERGSRQIDLVMDESETSPVMHRLPMYGQIPAGVPQELQVSEAEGSALFDEAILGFKPKEGCFLLKVRGDSMQDAGILNGDMVVIEPEHTPKAGQIVAALIDGESTLKRLVFVHGEWFLRAENASFRELHPRAELVIQGAVRMVVRQLH